MRLQPAWELSLYPEAAEAGGTWRSVRSTPEGPGRGSEPGRAAEVASRRAAGQLRRYCVANRLNRFATLTYADACRDPALLRENLADFFKALRAGLGGDRLPYAWAPEWHPGGHGLHAHLALGRYVSRSLIGQAWPHGFFSIKLLGDLPVGSGSLGEARAAARYLSKYVSKNLDADRILGLHRYDVAQGFQPGKLLLTGRTEEQVLSQASERMGRPPGYIWRSSDTEGWHGPPACWAQWD